MAGSEWAPPSFYRVVEELPGITDSLVIDTSSAAGEGDLLLFVVLTAGTDPDAAAKTLRTHIGTQLSSCHVPNLVIAVDSLPRTLNGKKCEVPIKRIPAGAEPDAVISRDAFADPDRFDEFLRVLAEQARTSAKE